MAESFTVCGRVEVQCYHDEDLAIYLAVSLHCWRLQKGGNKFGFKSSYGLWLAL